MANSDFEIEYWMDVFAYTPEWIDYGFIDIDFVKQQATQYIDGEDRDVEHYKWAAYRHVLANTDFSSHQRWREFLRVTEADPNEHLFRGALAELLDSDRVPPEWFLEQDGYSARLLAIPSIRRKVVQAQQRRTSRNV
jgi:hypothetical protein